MRGWRNDPRLKRLLRDAGLNTAATAVSSGLGLVRSALFARTLGVEGFGRIALVLSMVVLGRQIVSVRAWEWTTVEASHALTAEDPRKFGAVLRASWMIGAAVNVTAFIGLMVLARPACGWVLDDLTLAPLVRWAATQLLVSSFDETNLAILRTLGQFRFVAIFTIGSAILRLVVLAPVVLATKDVVPILMAVSAGQALVAAWLLAHTVRACRERFGVWPSGSARSVFRGWRSHARQIAAMSATDTLKTAAVDGDPMLIAALASPAAVGPYRAAFNVINGILSLMTPLYMTLFPEMTRAAAAKDAPTLRLLVRQSTVIGLLLGGAGAAAIALGAPLIIPLLYGPGFEPAVVDLRWMSLALLVLGVQWANPLFVSLRRPWWTLTMIAGGLMFKLACFALLIPTRSHEGAAIGYAANGIAIIVVALLLLQVARGRLRALAE